MPEKGLQITVPENNPIENLQQLLRDEEKTKILLLGVPPLSVIGNDFSPSILNKIILKLKNFNPDIICLDVISPDEIASKIYFNEISYYDFEVKNDINLFLATKKKLKLSVTDASLKFDSLLLSANSDQKISIQKREKIIQLALANFDLYSAALHYIYLSDSDKRKIKLDKKVIERLNSIVKSNNEKSIIGLRLAAELKLNRIYAINDESDKPDLINISEKLFEEMRLSEVYSSLKAEILNQTADDKLKEGLIKNDLLDFFTYLNSDSYAINSTNNNWSIYYKMFLDSRLDRTRVGLWEMKNLRIASNIREVSSFNPSKKILVIIDVSKKAFVEEYIKNMTDIKLVKFSDLN
jgi:hypothetical protein